MEFSVYTFILVLILSESKAKECTGPNINDIVTVISDINWKTLANQLELETSIIEADCNFEIDRALCYLRELVKKFIQSQPAESCIETVKKIGKALDELGITNKAHKLYERFGIIADSDDDKTCKEPVKCSLPPATPDDKLLQQLNTCTQQLDMKEMTIRQLQQEIGRKETEKNELVQAKDRELAQAQQQLRELMQQEQSNQHIVEKLRTFVAEIQNTLMGPETFVSKVSGPGLQSATVNHPTHVIVELTDSSNRPCSVRQKVTAELELISKATPTSSSRKPPAVHAAVATTSPSRYEVSYTAISRGQHKLHVQLNGVEINGSPFTITVYPDPKDLDHPVRVVTNLDNPYGIAFNSRREMIVTQCIENQNLKSIVGEAIQEYRNSTVKMSFPKGVAIDGSDNIYVCSDHKLQKFTSSGELVKCVGRLGYKEGEFNVPHGVTVHNNQVYVCDRNNHRIQIFDLDLNFIQSIGSRGKGRGKFNAPKDVKFDTDGNMYITEIVNARVQVLDQSGRFIRVFGVEEKGKLHGPSALHIVDKYVYVSDHHGHCIVVYETSGQFVTSFGKDGKDDGHFSGPRCVTSCAGGFIYVCDSGNDRIQIF